MGRRRAKRPDTSVPLCKEFEGTWGKRGVCGHMRQIGAENSTCTIADQRNFKDFRPAFPATDGKAGTRANVRFDFRTPEDSKRLKTNNCIWVGTTNRK